MRVLAIGDIHGCATALETLLGAVAPRPDDLVVTLGDYVDRGKRSREVLDRLIRLGAETQLVPILGNHDQMMLDARSGDPERQWWLEHDEYGRRTLRSYAGLEATLADVPAAHWAFLEGCRDFHETARHVFTHANAYPDVPLAEQPVYMLRWESFGEPAPLASGKTLVVGHTSQKSGRPKTVGHAICIDTHAHGRDGWLTCLDAERGWLWQANERGEAREGWLDDLAGDGVP